MKAREEFLRSTGEVFPASLTKVNVRPSVPLGRRVVVEGEGERKVVAVEGRVYRPFEVESEGGGDQGHIGRGVGGGAGGDVRIVHHNKVVGVDFRRKRGAAGVGVAQRPLVTMGIDVAADDGVVVEE